MENKQDIKVDMENVEGYSSQEFPLDDIEITGHSGITEVPQGSKLEPSRTLPKRDIEQEETYSPIFFYRHFGDLTEEVIDKVRTWEEVLKEYEIERGKPFGGSEKDRQEKKELRLKGDPKNHGFIRLPLGRGNMTGEVIMKYIPERKTFIGITKETFQGIRKLNAESHENYRVFQSIYELVYQYVLGTWVYPDGESFIHFERFRYDNIRIRKDDIFRKLGWETKDPNKKDMYDDKLQRSLFYLSGVRYLLFFPEVRGMKLNLSPVLINYRDTKDGYIVFSGNHMYFQRVERFILQTISQRKGLVSGKERKIFRTGWSRGENPLYVPPITPVMKRNGLNDKQGKILDYLHGESIRNKTRKQDEKIFPVKVLDLLGQIGMIPERPDLLNKYLHKLSKEMKTLEEKGLIKYSPKKRYGWKNDTLEVEILHTF